MGTFERYVVLDFEATCRAGPPPDPQEIIEFPSVLVDGTTFEVLDTFESFVRPVHHPILTEFCSELTSISQSDVDGAPTFPVVLERHLAWLQEHGLATSEDPPGHPYVLVTCGDWDLRTMLPGQLRAADLGAVPWPYRRWMNLKTPFKRWADPGQPSSMPGMLEALGLELEGTHHRGIDDCRNLARILGRLAEEGAVFEVTSTAATRPSDRPG
jgi:inhibitor of KinA sporulation pathway (predicted exonuclease)